MAPFDYCEMMCPQGKRGKVLSAVVGRSDSTSCPYPQYPYGKNENPYWKNGIYNKYKDYQVGCANTGIAGFKVSANVDIEVWGAQNPLLNSYLGRYNQTSSQHNGRPVFSSATGKFLFSTKWGTSYSYWVIGDSVTETANFVAYIRSDKPRPEFNHDLSWKEQYGSTVGKWRESTKFHAGSLGQRWGQLLFNACKSGDPIGNRRCSITDIHVGATICPKAEWTECADIGDVCPNTQKVLELHWWCLPAGVNFVTGEKSTATPASGSAHSNVGGEVASAPIGGVPESTCQDDDACLQAKPDWGAQYTCASSTQWCESWAADMACCKKSCGKCS
jgi:hypothetical protein